MTTISTEQEQFLKETGFSASKILQQGINSLMEATSEGDLKQLLEHKDNKIRTIVETMNKQRDFIEKQGLMLEFLKC
jgi:hypothetical protein